ncbi:unnamed protein product [Calypogeia fissa]
MGRASQIPLLLLPVAALMLLGHFSHASAVAFPDSLSSIVRFTSKFEGEADECGPQLSIETPKCKVVEKRDGYELRSYPKGQIWVQAVVEDSSYTVATVVGFYRCFYFISGQNEKKMAIEMTGPVLIKPVPEKSGYSISFFAPSRFASPDDLPKPNDANLKFVETEETIQAVIGPFGGFPTASDYTKKWEELKSKLDKDGVKYDESTVVYAGYSSPFEIFNRKQEVHVTLSK